MGGSDLFFQPSLFFGFFQEFFGRQGIVSGSVIDIEQGPEKGLYGNIGSEGFENKSYQDCEALIVCAIYEGINFFDIQAVKLFGN